METDEKVPTSLDTSKIENGELRLIVTRSKYETVCQFGRFFFVNTKL